MATRKEGTVFRWVTNMKSATIIKGLLLVIATLATWGVSWALMYGDDRWFAKEKGEALEKKHIVLEQDLEHRHELHMVHSQYMKDKLEKHSGELKEIKEIVSRIPR